MRSGQGPSSHLLARRLCHRRRRRPCAVGVPLVGRRLRCRLLHASLLVTVGQLVLGELLLADILGRRAVARATKQPQVGQVADLQTSDFGLYQGQTGL